MGSQMKQAREVSIRLLLLPAQLQHSGLPTHAHLHTCRQRQSSLVSNAESITEAVTEDVHLASQQLVL